ncbi:MAG: hypothetical protein L0H37_09095 [Nitrosospira sp.]|nr:hypothetical protein [Nitrosospira sp.]
MSSKHNQQLQKLFHAYAKEHGSEPTQLTDVAAWMVNEGYWQMRPIDVIHRCANDLSAALREEYRVDEKGRRYRANHAVRGEQGTLWADLDNAPHGHMEKAFAQRRRQIVGDCYQLKTDVDVYNDKHKLEEPINLVLNFTDDVAEKQTLDQEDAA